MGKVINAQRTETGMIFKVEVDFTEAGALKGRYNNIKVFSEDNTEFRTNISSRGKDSVTKYFLIPKHMRECIDLNSDVNCQKIETPDKYYFIYSVKKDKNEA